jgi:zinc protease
MYQLLGGAADPQKFTDIRSILSDYSFTTPEKMQALADRYLRKNKSWRVEVLPEKKAG